MKRPLWAALLCLSLLTACAKMPAEETRVYHSASPTVVATAAPDTTPPESSDQPAEAPALSTASAPTETPAPSTTSAPLPSPTAEENPSPAATETPSAQPSPVVAPLTTDGTFTVAIDAGHQAKGNSEKEPIGPGASETKAKVSSGTQGTTTRVPEYKLTLAVSLKLRDELLARGYAVVMIRETHDVNISNRERAVRAAEAGADILVRIHADGSENSGIHGILTMCPTQKNPYVAHLYDQSRALSDDILAAMVAATGAKNRGVIEADNMSGINWSDIPVTIVEMGLMTNPEEDRLMQTEEYQQKLAQGITDGIDRYVAR